MSTLLIEGGHRLEGRVAVEGNKNAALPLLAACLLTEDECVLTNVPRIGDVEVMARLLLDLGAEVEGIGTTTLQVRAATLRTHAPDRTLVGRLRGSVLLLGPLLARAGQAHIAPPGGDFPARRTIATHLDALRRHGRAAERRPRSRARGARRAEGRVDVSLRGVGDRHRDGAARRGARRGRHRDPPRRHRAARRRAVRVPREDGRRRVGHRLLHDPHRRRAAAARRARTRWAATTSRRGAGRSWARSPAARWRSRACASEDIEVVAAVLERMNVECGMRDGVFAVKPSKPSAAGRITTGLWPSFPSDLVSLVTVLATQAEGRTLVHDWMYELRLFALEQMSGMGADMFLADAHRIIVTGPTHAARRPHARQPRSALGDVADCRRVWRPKGRRAWRRSRPSSAATASSSIGCAAWARKVEKSRIAVEPACRRPLLARRSRMRRGRIGRSAGQAGGRAARRAARRPAGPRPAGSAAGMGSSIGPPPSPSRPTRNGRRSVSVRSSTRTMRGVSVRTMSVSCVSRFGVGEQPADDRQVAQAGHALEHAALVVANQAGEQVRLAVLQPDHRVDRAVAERRQPAEAGARDAADLDLERQRHLVVVMGARRDVDVHADVLVVERRDRLLRHAAGGDRREGGDRHRHALAEPACAAMPSDVRSCGLASVRVLLSGFSRR